MGGSSSPMQLSLRYLREQGWLAQPVERWLPQQEPGLKERREALLGCAASCKSAGEQLLGLVDGERLAKDDGYRQLATAAAGLLARLQLDFAGAAPAEATGPPGKRVDLYGIIDILALDGQPGCLGVQACAYSGVSTHLREIKEGRVKLPAERGEKARECPKLELAARWLAAGNRLWVIGWRKVGHRWQSRVVNVTEELLYAA